MPRPVTLDDLRRHAVARTLSAPTTLPAALRRLGFVQADPIRAPARAQDLTLRHRVKGYAAGDLERRYPGLPVEEDFFVNYGFIAREHQQLMHPRQDRTAWSPQRLRQAREVLAFVRERGVVHPRDVDAQFRHGTVQNWFGGRSLASTQLLDGMHYRGQLRVARREGGVRLYAERAAWSERSARLPASVQRERLDALVDRVVGLYAPLPAATLSQLVMMLRHATPQWDADRARALQHAKARLAQARVDGVDWYWPADEDPRAARHRQQADDSDTLRLLAPFDPIVWDRCRFERLWGWAYRFEAYTPAARRRLGYYALPLLWRGQVIGWANLGVRGGALQVHCGHVAGRPPRDAAYRRALDDELARMHSFLGLP